MDKSLKLSEKLFCLAVNPKNGGILLSASSAMGMTLTGSVFVELMNKGLITVENGLVHVSNPAIQSDEVHEFFMSIIRHRRKDRKMRNWISYFSNRRRKIQKLYIRNLVRKNVLRTEEKHILFIPYEKVYLMDRVLVESIRQEVENTSLGKAVSTDEALILAILTARTNLLPRILADRAQRKIAARLLQKLPETPVSKAVLEAIQMAHAAAYAAIS